MEKVYKKFEKHDGRMDKRPDRYKMRRKLPDWYSGEACRAINEHEPRMSRCKGCKSEDVEMDYFLGEYRCICVNCGKHTKPFKEAFRAVQAWNGGQISMKI